MFNLNTSSDYFFYIDNAINSYKSKTNKSIQELFFIINGLNHLREWIAPDYNYENKPQNNNEIFFNNIWSLNEFRTINQLCNGTKHLKNTKLKTSAEFGLPLSKWDNVDSVLNFDDGPPSAFYVDSRDIIEIILVVHKYYKSEWFDKLQYAPIC